MLSDLKDNHFKSFKPKSDFFRNYKKTGRADPKVLAKIREQARINNRRDLSKRLILLLIALILVAIVAYLLPKLNEL